MKSITIHNLDDQIYANISSIAQAEGMSLNAVMKKLLRLSLGISVAGRKNDLSKFAGAWSDAEYTQFLKSQHVFERIDQEDWR